MSNQFQFELVSPEKLIFSQNVAMITIPGGEGEYGVLVDHAPMITTVKPGVIEIFADTDGAASERIFVSGGFAEVTQTRCTVLADEAIPVKLLNRTKLEEELRHLNEKMTTLPEPEHETLLTAQAVISAKIQATS